MKTIFLTLITASAIIFYSSSTPSPDYNAKISIAIPELSDASVKENIDKEIQPIRGIEGHSINLDTKTLELIVDLNSFSLEDLMNSLDLMGLAFDDPKVENIYY